MYFGIDVVPVYFTKYLACVRLPANIKYLTVDDLSLESSRT